MCGNLLLKILIINEHFWYWNHISQSINCNHIHMVSLISVKYIWTCVCGCVYGKLSLILAYVPGLLCNCYGPLRDFYYGIFFPEPNFFGLFCSRCSGPNWLPQWAEPIPFGPVSQQNRASESCPPWSCIVNVIRHGWMRPLSMLIRVRTEVIFHSRLYSLRMFSNLLREIAKIGGSKRGKLLDTCRLG